MAIAQVNLGESAIRALMKNAAALDAFSFLRSPPMVKKTKRCCGGSVSTSTQPNFEWIKQNIVSLSPEGRVRLRQFLNARRVVVTYRSGRENKTVTL